MFSTRSIRLIVTIVALITVVGILAASHGEINSQVAKMKDKQQDVVPDEEVSNTLQGKPYKGTEAPYGQGGAGQGSPKGTKPIIADTSDSKKAHADKNKAVGGESGENVPPSLDKGLSDPNEAAKMAPNKQSAPQKTPAKEGCSDQEYVIMIDAGSTGSRVHIYQFDTCTAPPALIKETFEKLEPGLSSFDTDTKGAAASLNGLMDLAIKTVPKNKQGCTPVAVKATAGLRLLGEEKSSNILKEVRAHLQNDYPFAVVDGDGIAIMDGKDEGVYAWITTNYLLGNIGAEQKLPTAAVFDLGGGSTQIVFEPEFGTNEKMLDGDHKYSLTFGNKEYKLYQYSHLGFGLMEGRNKINALVVKANLKSNSELSKAKYSDKQSAKAAKASVTLTNVCVPVGVTAENVLVKMADDEYYVVNMEGPKETTTGAQCRALAETVLNKESDCTEKPCSFNGIYQPSLTKSFSRANDMFIFSFFYDRTNPLGFPSSFTVEELTELAKVVCGGDKFWSEVLLDDHVKQLQEEPQWCLDLSFITAMLHTGYDIPLHRELRTARKIADNEVGWCLGASLPLLDKSSGWSCRITESP